jgi:prevent-host-death family protein
MYESPDEPGSDTQVSVSEAREAFADLINRAAYRHERVLISRRGRAIAAIVPIEDVEALERLEDEYDLKAVEEALAEGGEPIPWEQIERELELKDR